MCLGMTFFDVAELLGPVDENLSLWEYFCSISLQMFSFLSPAILEVLLPIC